MAIFSLTLIFGASSLGIWTCMSNSIFTAGLKRQSVEPPRLGRWCRRLNGIETAAMIRKGQLSDENRPVYQQLMALAVYLCPTFRAGKDSADGELPSLIHLTKTSPGSTTVALIIRPELSFLILMSWPFEPSIIATPFI